VFLCECHFFLTQCQPVCCMYAYHYRNLHTRISQSIVSKQTHENGSPEPFPDLLLFHSPRGHATSRDVATTQTCHTCHVVGSNTSKSKAAGIESAYADTRPCSKISKTPEYFPPSVNIQEKFQPVSGWRWDLIGLRSCGCFRICSLEDREAAV
jgi:hypothetical protein